MIIQIMKERFTCSHSSYRRFNFFLSLVLNLIIFYDNLNIGLRLFFSLLFLSSFFLILGLIDDKSSLTPTKR